MKWSGIINENYKKHNFAFFIETYLTMLMPYTHAPPGQAGRLFFSWLTNLTKIESPTDIMTGLSRGYNFVYPSDGYSF